MPSILDDLFYNVGKQPTYFQIARATKDNDSIKWSKWKDYLSATEYEKENANNRTILDIEIVLDIDRETKDNAEEDFNKIIEQLDSENFKYKAYFTGSKGFHIHLIFQELRNLNEKERKKIKEDFINRFNCDIAKATDRCMIALENTPHWKTGNLKQLNKEKTGINYLNDIKENKNNFLKKQAENLSTVFYRNKLDLAEEFHKIQPFFYDKNCIWWSWDWSRMRYIMVDETDIISIIDKAIGRATRVVQERALILESFKIIGRQKIPQDLPKNQIQFKNCIYDLSTNKEISADPKYFCVNPISWNLGKSDKTPILDKLFSDWVKTEEEVKLLYEIIAYCLIPEYPLHRVFALYGKGSNGKSVYLNILTKFLGMDNCCSSSFEGLTTNRFESAKLYKKLMCKISEIHDKTVSKTALFKNLSGDDTIGFEFKNKNPFDAHNYAKILIATNIIPISQDDTDGFFRRWIIVDFPNQFADKKDILGIIPPEEFENLSRKSLKILKDLLIRREFSTDCSIEEKKKRYNERANPIDAFIFECCEQDINADYILNDAYSEYCEFLQKKGFRVLTKNDFSKVLRTAGYKVKLKTINGFNATYIEGLKAKINQINGINHFSNDALRVSSELKQINLVNSVNSEAVKEEKILQNFDLKAFSLDFKQSPDYAGNCQECGHIADKLFRNIPLCFECAKTMATKKGWY